MSIPSVPSLSVCGVIGDWDRPYLTLTHDYEAAQIEIFGEMATEGLHLQGPEAEFTGARTTRPHWLRQRLSTRMFRKSIFVKFAVTDDKGVITKLLGTSGECIFRNLDHHYLTIPGNLGNFSEPELRVRFR